MRTDIIDLAVHAIRYFVMNFGDEHTVIGQSISVDDINWLTGLLDLQMPPSYLRILYKHDGMHTRDSELYTLRESFDVLMTYRQYWFRSTGFWPVSGDGCGNYYVLRNLLKSEDAESPVAFLDHEQSFTEPAYYVASSYAHCCFFQMVRLCAQENDRSLIPDFHGVLTPQSWPFDPDFVLHYDPDLAHWQPQSAWPL